MDDHGRRGLHDNYVIPFFARQVCLSVAAEPFADVSVAGLMDFDLDISGFIICHVDVFRQILLRIPVEVPDGKILNAVHLYADRLILIVFQYLDITHKIDPVMVDLLVGAVAPEADQIEQILVDDEMERTEIVRILRRRDQIAVTIVTVEGELDLPHVVDGCLDGLEVCREDVLDISGRSAESAVDG